MIKSINDKVLNLEACNLTVKALDDDGTITVEGFANTTTKDRQGDVILEEAWTKGGLDNYLRNPIVLAYHDPTRPIGEVIDYGVSNKGLKVVAEISKAAGDVYELVKNGILKAFSVGFRVKDADYDSDTELFVIKDLELYELSVVSIPANAESIFSVRKSFDNEEDYLNFRKQYSSEIEEIKEEPTIIEEPKMEKTKVEEDTKLSLTPEELEERIAKAIADNKAAEEAKKAEEERITTTAISAGKSGAEKLLEEFEKRMSEKDKSLEEALDGLRTELKEKAEELEAIQRSKMSFTPNSREAISKDEIDTAVLAAKALGKDITSTKFFEQLKTKAGAHLGGTTDADGWETEFSTRLYEDIKNKTVIEPLFRNRIQMNSRTMTFAYNPDAGYAEWVAEGAYRGVNSTGSEVDHQPIDNTLKAEKLASKEYLGYEEEEDAIISLMPIIREAVVRRVVRSTDTELLRADSDGSATGSGTTPTGFNGVATLAGDINAGADYQYVQPGSFGDATTIADLQQTRRLMGAPGLMPGDCVYVVSQSVYFDLLEDPDFRTMDLVGSNATILTGQVGTINGSPVLVSDSFATDAVNTVQAVCLNQSNYLFGELRGMMVERDRDIEHQKNILVATRRFAFNEIVPAVAVATKRQSYCANLVRPAT